MVEVRGVEPLSEMCSTQANYVRSLLFNLTFSPAKRQACKKASVFISIPGQRFRGPSVQIDSTAEERYLAAEFGRTIRRPWRKNNLPHL